MILPAGGRLLVVGFDPVNQPAVLSAFRGKYGLPDNLTILGPYRGRLDNSRESVSLSRPDLPQMPPQPDAGFVPYVLVDRVAYSDTSPWPTNADGGGTSLQRLVAGAYGNDPANWKAAAPTPQSTDFGAVDSDGDGLSDLWEIVNHLRPDDPEDAAFDFDSDGFTNLQEYIAGTNPRDAGSALNFETEILSGTTFSITFTAMAGKSYTVQYRDSLSSGFWQKLADVAPQAASTVVQVNDSGANGAANRYYRIVTPAVP